MAFVSFVFMRRAGHLTLEPLEARDRFANSAEAYGWCDASHNYKTLWGS